MATQYAVLQQWVDEVARLTQPADIHWCDGSEAEYQTLVNEMLASGEFIELNQKTHPGCYLHRSDPTDVARVEHLTFVCTSKEEDAGPNNHWMAPAEAHAKIDALYAGAMKGRTMYVIPYCMGPLESPLSRCGVEITDSRYVVVNMHKMTRSGTAALKRIERDQIFVKGWHSVAELDPQKRLIMHFPEELTIKSVGSGYGGNALLGKKCHALRIASYQGRTEGWLAEHMLIMGIQNPQGKVHYIAAAFPSACGKTNLAMLIPPKSLPGWKIWTVGDDICWLHPGEDGRLWAINPEAGFFGVAPGTNEETNPNALAMLYKDAIFTNVGVTADNQPWWEGLSEGEPVFDWQGRPYDGSTPAAHPNSRFTASIENCPSYSEEAQAARGVPISAIVFGGRRESLVPLVMQARNWEHGVLMGASMASETTAAATGAVGVVRRDSMAMKPFCGYNYGDYWAHWLSFADRCDQLPEIFHVNWFRKNASGEYLWPGFGDNLRVLEWVMRRCDGEAEATDTAIGYLPGAADIDISGLDVSEQDMLDMTTFDRVAYVDEMNDLGQYLASYGDRLPAQMLDQLAQITRDLG